MIGIQAPYKYLQGPGLMDELGKHVEHIGKNFLILGSKTILKKKQDSIKKSFDDSNLKCDFVLFGGEVTQVEYIRVASLAKEGEADAIIGLGGGKVIDTAKAAAHQANIQVISAPSTASNDSPCSSLSVIYNEEGHVDHVETYPTNPALVIVDSEVILDAPIKTLVSGMGDALATYFESRVCHKHGYTNPLGTNISNTAIAMGELCYKLLIENGRLAKKCVESKVIDQSLENIIEANIYLSGIGFESGGLSCAHSIQNALTTITECRDNTMHGDRVAFGTICLLILEDSWEEIEEVMDFYKDIGLPVTFKDLHITEDIEDKIKSILPIALGEGRPAYHMPPGTTSEKMYEAMILADKLGRKAKS